MKTVKNYDVFSEEYRLNENLLKKAWGKVSNYFRKKWKDLGFLYYGLFLKKTGQLPKEKVEIFVPDSMELDTIPEESELALESIDITNLKVGDVNEALVDLDHPDQDVLNVDIDGLKKKIGRIFRMNNKRVEAGKERSKNHAVFIWGAPGIGKTEILHQVANENDAIVLEWHLSQIDPTDFRGIPTIENTKNSGLAKDERTVSKLPEMFPDEDTKSKGIIFFDEMNQAPQMVLSAALSLCLNGRIGSYNLPDGWIVVAAGNRAIDLGDAPPTTIAPQLANRFSHVNYTAKLEDWTKWALSKDTINPDIITFLKFKPQYFHKLDPDKEPKAWPSPRSWELASEEDYDERNNDWSNNISQTDLNDIYQATIGAEAATAFAAYLELKKFYNEKDVEKVFKIGDKAKQLPSRTDQSYAASASIASFKKGKELTVDEVENLYKFAMSMKDLESRTPLMSLFSEFHPEVKTDSKYKVVYWKYVKLWHDDVQKLNKKH